MADPFLKCRLSTRHAWTAFAAAGLVWTTGCMPVGPAEVSPEDIPQLEREMRLEPRNGDRMLRFAAGLFAAEQCDSAMTVAQVGEILTPDHALAPMLIGQCHEQDADYDEAIAVYERFVQRFPEAVGVASIRARTLLARRDRATISARDALAREAELAAAIPNPQAVAVLPLAINGDSIYHPLGRGLAQMIISDLALLQQFQLVERLQVGALLDELALGQTTRMDPATTARVGRLVQAGRMVQGLADIPDENAISLDAAVVLADGQLTAPAPVTGRLRDLLIIEKELVMSIAGLLGYQVSASEQQQILENGTQNLTAFLAYSNGLIAEDIGDYPTAALFFSQAIQADPGFAEAREQFEANSIAPQVQGASVRQVTTVTAARVVQPDAPPAPNVVQNAVRSSVGDVASTAGEKTTEGSQDNSSQGTGQSTQTNAASPGTTTTSTGTTTTVTGTIRIIFKLP